jgi:hypothetical protein
MSYLKDIDSEDSNYCRIYIGNTGTFTSMHSDPVRFVVFVRVLDAPITHV